MQVENGNNQHIGVNESQNAKFYSHNTASNDNILRLLNNNS